MSTRANIVVKDQWGNKLWFYRHSDGYPEGALPLLAKFMQAVVNGEIRANVSQAAGHLIMLGAREYEGVYPQGCGMDWKVGAIEPTTAQHGDIEYLYVLDLENKTIDVKTVRFWFGKGRVPRGNRIARLEFNRGLPWPMVVRKEKGFDFSVLDLTKRVKEIFG